VHDPALERYYKKIRSNQYLLPIPSNPEDHYTIGDLLSLNSKTHGIIGDMLLLSIILFYHNDYAHRLHGFKR